MTNKVHYPSPAEIHAYETKARLLRAETMRVGFKASITFVKSFVRGVVSLLTRPAHA